MSSALFGIGVVVVWEDGNIEKCIKCEQCVVWERGGGGMGVW